MNRIAILASLLLSALGCGVPVEETASTEAGLSSCEMQCQETKGLCLKDCQGPGGVYCRKQCNTEYSECIANCPTSPPPPSAPWVVLPTGISTSAGKAVKLKYNWNGFFIDVADGLWTSYSSQEQHVVRADSNSSDVRKFELSVSVLAPSRCHVLVDLDLTNNGHSVVENVDRDVDCSNFFWDDESDNGAKNNRQGIDLNGFAQMRPKNADRVRVLLDGKELELDTQE
jgi:hypothetical protein